jgi:hypothetical protein
VEFGAGTDLRDGPVKSPLSDYAFRCRKLREMLVKNVGELLSRVVQSLLVIHDITNYRSDRML